MNGWIGSLSAKEKERQACRNEHPKKEKDRNYPEDKNNKGDKKDREVLEDQKDKIKDESIARRKWKTRKKRNTSTMRKTGRIY